MWFSLAARSQSAAQAGTFTTAFPATENPISQGGIWLNGLTDGLDWNDIQTVAGHAYSAAFDTASGGVSDGICNLKRSFLACTRKQFSAGTVFRAVGYNPNVAHEIAVYVNMTIDPAGHSVTGYEFYRGSGGTTALIRWEGPWNTFTAIGTNTIPAPADGDVQRIENDGAGNLTCYVNGVPYITVLDTTWTGGNPGIGNNPPTGGSPPAVLSSLGFSSWTGGSL